MLDLPAQYYGELLGLLERHLPGAEVWAYGSRVKGGAHGASDLDLVVMPDMPPVRAGQGVAALRSGLSESNLPILVDVLEWANIPEGFRQEIIRKHAVLKQGGGAWS